VVPAEPQQRPVGQLHFLLRARAAPLAALPQLPLLISHVGETHESASFWSASLCCSATMSNTARITCLRDMGGMHPGWMHCCAARWVACVCSVGVAVASIAHTPHWQSLRLIGVLLISVSLSRGVFIF
jgi:hypothetical protein